MSVFAYWCNTAHGFIYLFQCAPFFAGVITQAINKSSRKARVRPFQIAGQKDQVKHISYQVVRSTPSKAAYSQENWTFCWCRACFCGWSCAEVLIDSWSFPDSSAGPSQHNLLLPGKQCAAGFSTARFPFRLCNEFTIICSESDEACNGLMDSWVSEETSSLSRLLCFLNSAQLRREDDRRRSVCCHQSYVSCKQCWFPRVSECAAVLLHCSYTYNGSFCKDDVI